MKLRERAGQTRRKVSLLPIARQIIDRYRDDRYGQMKNCLLPVSSNQMFNAYLKEIATICGINKYLTSHTARHTFATSVTLEQDVPIETVSRLPGYKSIRITHI